MGSSLSDSSRNSSPPADPLATLQAELAQLVSERDEARRLVRTVTHELEHLRAELSETREKLERATHAAEAAGEARDRFISNVSHELRTPLSAILLWSSLIDEQQADPQLAEALSAIKRSADEQSAMIDDIVDTSRLLAGKLRVEPEQLDLLALVHDAAEVVRAAANEKAVTFRIEVSADDFHFRGDARQLRRAVVFLLHNAINASPRQELVTVRLQRRGTAFHIQIEDHGPGISPERLPGLLEREPSLQGKCARTEIGLGLGLPLARRIVRLHHGDLSATAAPSGTGALFTLTLPAAEPTRARSSIAPPTAEQRILVAGLPADAPELSVLSELGAAVLPADSLEAAEAAYRRESPLLIVAGIDEGGFGIELLRGIRLRDDAGSSRSVPAIALTASGSAREVERALEAGFQTCLARPVDRGEFRATVESLLERDWSE